MHTDAQERLRAAILAQDHAERYVLTDRLGRAGVDVDRDLPLLVELLLDPDLPWLARSLAVWEIGKLGPPAGAAADDLAAVALDRESFGDVRWASVWALERLGPGAVSAGPSLLDLLASDDDPDLRSQTAAALGALGAGKEVAPGLAAVLDDPDSLVREEAARALGRVGPASAGAAGELARLAAGDEVVPVRAAAAEALGRLNGSAPSPAVEPPASLSAPASLPGLLERLGSSDPRTRAETTWPLGKLGADAAPALAPVVRQLRRDHDPDARWGAAWVVGRIGPAAAPAVGEVAAAAREDPDPDVRSNAARALGWIGVPDEDAVAALVAALGDGGASLLREEALVALGRIGRPAARALPAIRARLADPHPMVRGRAQAALAAVIGEL